MQSTHGQGPQFVIIRLLTSRQTNTQKAIQEPDIMEEMSISTKLNDSAKNEH